MEATVRRTRQVGSPTDGPRLERELAARGLDGQDLARLAGLGIDTISRARRSERLGQRSLRQIRDALSRVPVDPLLGALVGINPTTSPENDR